MAKHPTLCTLAHLLAVASLAAPACAQQRPAAEQHLARAVADLSANGCYGIAAGTTLLPSDRSPDILAQTMRVVEAMGLTFGINDRMFKALARPGQTLVASATMGSKALDGGDIVVSFGGRQPGCRVILLTDGPIAITDAVGAGVASAGWKAVPAMTAQRGALERRAFVKRDARGAPYLMNLMTLSDPSSKLRVVTTTVRVPAGVTLPPGF
jgi:hypothetical protein